MTSTSRSKIVRDKCTRRKLQRYALANGITSQKVPRTGNRGAQIV